MSKPKNQLSEIRAFVGKKGGLVGGPARAKSLTQEERKRIASLGGIQAKKKYEKRRKISETLKKNLARLSPKNARNGHSKPYELEKNRNRKIKAECWKTSTLSLGRGRWKSTPIPGITRWRSTLLLGSTHKYRLILHNTCISRTN